VESGLEALDPAAKSDVVLLDMWLQDGCGMDVLLHVRRQNLELAVVIVAGSGDEGSAIQYLKAGAQDYVPKRGMYLEQLGGHLMRAQETARQHPPEYGADRAVR